jgi:hypothetical protein
MGILNPIPEGLAGNVLGCSPLGRSIGLHGRQLPR